MSWKIYSPKSYIAYFRRQVRHQRIMYNMPISYVPNGVIAVDSTPGGYGVFDVHGKFIRQSLFYRNKTPQYIPNMPAADIPYFDFDAVYLGNIDPAFGHFLLEHWNRTYAFLDKKYHKMKFVIINDRRINPLPNFVFEAAKLLGIPAKNFIILDKSARFRNVYVPAQGFNLPKTSSNEFGKTFTAMARNTKGCGIKKLYASRNRLNSRRAYGEEKIEKIFEKNGFTIYYPETLSLPEHVALLRNCRVLAGQGGSALHMSLFMPARAKVIQLRRNTIRRDNAPTQWLLCQTKNQSFTVIAASVEKFKTDHGDNAPQIIGMTPELKQFFDDNNFEYSVDDLAPDTVAMGEYLDALEKYRASVGSPLRTRILNKVMMLLAIFIPGRRDRGKFRKWFRKTVRF